MKHLTFVVASSWLLRAALTAPVDPCNQAGGLELPLVRDPVFGYLGNVTLGTPAQTLTMFYDWTWTSPYFLSATCSNNTQTSDKCYASTQQLFHQDKSSTFKNMSTEYSDQVWYPNEFLPAPFEVSYGTDLIGVGGAGVPVTVQLSDIPTGLLVQMPIEFGGIMGLMPTFENTSANHQSAFYQLWKLGIMPSPLAAFVICSSKLPCPAGVDAIQTFGGPIQELAGADLTWYPLTSVPTVNQIDFAWYPEVFNYWSIELESFSIGTAVQELNTSMAQTAQAKPAAIFDHASKGRGLPLSKDAYAQLVDITKATPAGNLPVAPNNGQQSFYTVDCSKISTFPTVSYVFTGNSKQWVVKPENYVANLSGTCVLDVRVLGSGAWELGNFGDNFLADKYIVFDYEKNMVGLADL